MVLLNTKTSRILILNHNVIAYLFGAILYVSRDCVSLLAGWLVVAVVAVATYRCWLSSSFYHIHSLISEYAIEAHAYSRRNAVVTL